MIRTLLIAAVLVGLATPAEAVNKSRVRKVVEAAGLMGWWAQDCSALPSVENAWHRFAIDEDGYVVDADFEGPDGMPYMVVEARKLRNGDIWMRQEVVLGEPDQTVTYRIENGRHRLWTARNAEGVLVVDQGVWTNTDEVGGSVWYEKCPGAPAWEE